MHLSTKETIFSEKVSKHYLVTLSYILEEKRKIIKERIKWLVIEYKILEGRYYLNGEIILELMLRIRSNNIMIVKFIVIIPEF